MRRILYIQLIIAISCLGSLVGCQDNSTEESANQLCIKAFSPTVVMEGAEMTIMGSCLEQVNGIVFPGNIKVSDFSIVTQNQIRLTITSGIQAEGGHLQLVSEDGFIESTTTMRVAKPEIKSMLPGDEVGVGQELTIKGVDLEYTQQVIFPSKNEGKDIIIEAIDFLRKAPESIKVTVPNDAKMGEYSIKLIALNGETTLTEPITISNSAASGKLETDVYYTIWENADGLSFSGWSNADDAAFQSEYFAYFGKEGYEYKIYFTYQASSAGGIGMQRQNSSNRSVIYTESDGSKLNQLVERQEARDYKQAQVELQTCVPNGADMAVIRGAAVTVYKIEIVFSKIP